MRLRCTYCSYVGDLKDFEVDYLLPLSHFGANAHQNLRRICSGCNRQKGSMTPEEYIVRRVVNWGKANFEPEIRGVKT